MKKTKDSQKKDKKFITVQRMTSSCFHIHENKKLGGSTIC